MRIRITATLRLLTIALGLAGIIAVVACGSSSNGSPASPTPSTGSGNSGSTGASFATIESTIIVPRCTGCHGGASPSAGMSLEASAAYSNLVNVTSGEKSGAVRVIPGDPNNSYLVQKLRGDPGIVGLRMPRNGPPYLTDDQINLVIQWIVEGAKNN